MAQRFAGLAGATRRVILIRSVGALGAAGVSALAACGVGQAPPSGGGASQGTGCHSQLDLFVAAGPGTARYETYSDALKTLSRPNCSVNLAVLPSGENLLAK